jgi:ABC-type transporter Mla subunit MlaD
MNLLNQLLQNDNLQIPNLEDEVKALGYNPENLSDDDTLTLASKLKEKFSSKLSKNRQKTKPMNNDKPIEIATDKAAKQVDAIVSQYKNLADKVVERKSTEIIQIIENIPNATMNRVRQLLDDSEGNLDFFLKETGDVESAFFSKFNIE